MDKLSDKHFKLKNDMMLYGGSKFHNGLMEAIEYDTKKIVLKRALKNL